MDLLLAYLPSGLVLGYGLILLKKPFFSLATRSVDLLNVLIAELDEDEKYRVVSSKVGPTIKELLLLLLAFVAVVAATYGAFLMGTVLLHSLLPNSAPHPLWGLLVLSLAATVPFLRAPKSKSGYSEVSQLFHHLVLDNTHLGKRLFKSQINGIEHPVPVVGPGDSVKTTAVIITGLARTGTTVLAKELAARGPFKSLTYANLPFLLAPKLWGRIYRPKSGELEERAHGDGIKVGKDSVEALEEYFFQTFGPQYVEQDKLLTHTLDGSLNDLYRRYQRSLTGDDRIYLAKNNNAILRYPSLVANNPDFAVFILFRDPLDHAYSLLKQHQRFLQKQDEDPFVLTFMNWLGHYEFGHGQRPFDLPTLPKAPFAGDATSLNYWLERWISYYSYVLTLDRPQLISFETFTKDPQAVLASIAEATGLAVDPSGLEPYQKTAPDFPEHDAHLAQRAMEIYSALNEASFCKV